MFPRSVVFEVQSAHLMQAARSAGEAIAWVPPAQPEPMDAHEAIGAAAGLPATLVDRMRHWLARLHAFSIAR
ncbi:hypothetical protein QNA08_00515 [Chelatococcus sp. SYSU_G07232]|uniref:Uncharacterized protein n=1 Tax=Chelatococcus albus TaxID=3047466 RepID=A0ABT7ABI2_9HYPH|nr:hypothetical protein [Chelatococcus sp. SYSU_G07232]MDJ1156732.1 hypothetical protein [Chelatococcus sp. SYSU_G07232]